LSAEPDGALSEPSLRVRSGDCGHYALDLSALGSGGHRNNQLHHRVQQIMLENRRTLPLLFAARQPELRRTYLERLKAKHVIVACGEATRSFFRIAAKWTATCIPGSTLIRVPNARHLLPVYDETRFTTVVLEPYLTPAS
jgi:hypothetical protein